ncbi:MAG: hypothetical protein NZ524_00095 [Thiobacillaceae bacterium]|nr:hypothetical protein [Thiobacillaceae bacterium]MCX7672047.1 hypothetical protein [Thiobacillaceae bacterium]MDW8323811.1 hypothetical protein [Burkholderiales bacterium]
MDVGIRVSPELAALLEAHVNNPDALEMPTLGSVRAALAQGSAGEGYEADRLHPETGENLLQELDSLIDEFGVEAPAADFIRPSASEALSRVIEAVMEQATHPPTLADVHEAMQSGLIAQLVGEGVLDEDEDETLMAEIEDLIDRYGEEAPAEEFIHYE